MKLLHCHIENYGNLNNVDFDFDSGITQFCEENGFGKTTLASFLKAMFYGLPPYKANSKDFNDRKRFYPFNGGKFGGNLSFEMDGKQYRIERYFDKKSDTNDSCVVYCNGKPAPELAKDIGKSIFGLDKEAFERTIFITADDVEVGSTSGINAKLNNFVDDTSDDNTFESAVEALDNYKKTLRAGRGSRDLITATSQKIEGIRGELNNIDSVSRSLDGYYEQEKTLKESISTLENDIKRVNSENLLHEKWKQYQSKIANKTADEKALEVVEQNYPNGLPTADEVKQLKACNTKLISLKGQRMTVSFDDQKQARLNSLSSKFANGVPDGDYMSGLQADINSVARLETEISSLENVEKNIHEDDYEKKFGGNIPSAEVIAQARAKVDRVREVENNIKALNDLTIATNAMQANSAKSKGKTIGLAVLVLAILAMIGGVALLFVNAIVGGVVLGIGCVLFAVGAILFFKKQNTDGKTAIQPNLDLARLQAESKGLTDEVRAFLVPFGYYSPDGIAVDFATFENSLAEYKQILAINAQRSAQIEDKKSKCAQLTAQINDRFNNYGVSSQNAQSAYISLEHEIVEFNSLKGEQIRATEGEARLNSQIEESQQTIIQTLDKYNLPLEQNLAEQFEKLDKDRSERERLTQSIAMWTAQAETYKEQNGLTQMPEGQAVDVDELNGQLSEKRRALAVIEGQISDAESIVEKLDEKKAQLENEEEKLAGYRRKLTVVSGAIDSLKQAETNLKDKYVMPIKDKFIHYSDILEKALGEKVTMDQDFRVTFERGGENRSDKHFSAGQRNILALCFRLALIDNMYENEKPFIIMDDPFVNLDENHIEKARTLVKQLAGDKQIIYFCCHESRKI